MTVAEKLRLLAELAETEDVFKIDGDEYQFTNGILGYCEDNCGLMKSKYEISDIKSSAITRLPFKPKLKQIYYIIDFWESRGYGRYVYSDTPLDERLLSREAVYRTEAEAQEEVRKRGWTVEN
jgi:hypothetical protein